MNQYICDNGCKYFDNSDETNHCFGLIFCTKHQMLVEPIFQEESKILGCASHSSYQSERDAVLDVVKTLHKDIIENNLGWEEICGSLEDIMEELRQKAGEP
jgi:hypothetical protein